MRIKRLILVAIIGSIMSLSTTYAYADTLDEIINQQEVDYSSKGDKNGSTKKETSNSNSNKDKGNLGDGAYLNDSQIDSVRDAANLSESSPQAVKINNAIKKGSSLAVQVMSYFIVALLIVRILLDIGYIALPFIRPLLNKGYNGQQQGAMGQTGMMGTQNPFGGGFSGGFGNSPFSQRGYGMSGMNGLAGQQAGVQTAIGKSPLVSMSAVKAVDSEAQLGPDGKTVSPLRMYAKDMVVVLVLVPLFIILAMTGALQNLGFLLGEVIARAIGGLSGMI